MLLTWALMVLLWGACSDSPAATTPAPSTSTIASVVTVTPRAAATSVPARTVTPPPTRTPTATATPTAGGSRPGGGSARQGGQPALSLAGSTDLGGRGFNGNVRALGTVAYVGSWGSGGLCPALGVRAVDLTDPAQPTVIGTMARFAGTSAEDVVPVRVQTPAFAGDLLATGIQRCSGGGAAPAGLALTDISDPSHPVELGFFDIGSGARGVHELDVVKQGDRVLALLAVPFGERSGGGDLVIVDISDPRDPRRLAVWGAQSALGIRQGVGCNRSVYDHSVSGSRDGLRAYLSYWDAGVIMLDISEPGSPVVVGRIAVPGTEGAVHSAIELPNGLLLVTEEDDVFQSPRGLTIRAAGGGTEVEVTGCQSAGSDLLDSEGVINGPLVSVANPCQDQPAAQGAIVVTGEQRGCAIGAAARAAQAGGARALVVGIDAEAPESRRLDGLGAQIPVVFVTRGDAERLTQVSPRGEGVGQLPSARPWGAARLWDISNPARPVQRSAFRTRNALAFPPPDGGYYTVHNPLWSGRYALFSWYADGVRVVDISDPARPVEVAAYVPPAVRDPFGFFPTAATVWGVALAGDLVLASDVNGGLYVLKSTDVVGEP